MGETLSGLCSSKICRIKPSTQHSLSKYLLKSHEPARCSTLGAASWRPDSRGGHPWLGLGGLRSRRGNQPYFVVRKHRRSHMLKMPLSPG